MSLKKRSFSRLAPLQAPRLFIGLEILIQPPSSSFEWLIPCWTYFCCCCCCHLSRMSDGEIFNCDHFSKSPPFFSLRCNFLQMCSDASHNFMPWIHQPPAWQAAHFQIKVFTKHLTKKCLLGSPGSGIWGCMFVSITSTRFCELVYKFFFCMKINISYLETGI